MPYDEEVSVRSSFSPIFFLFGLCGLAACTGGATNTPPKTADLDVPVMSTKADPLGTTTSAKAVEETAPVVKSRVRLPSEEHAIGAPAPGFSLKAMSPQPGALVELHLEKVTVVHYWATWCMPCRMLMPKLNELYTRYRSRGFEVVAVSVDDEDSEIPNFARETQVQFPLVWDNKHALVNLYQPRTMPTTYLIDRDGLVKFIQPGFHSGGETELEAEIEKLL